MAGKGDDEGVPGHNITYSHAVKEAASGARHGHAGVASEHGVVGKDVGLRHCVEQVACAVGETEGKEEGDEMVGEEGEGGVKRLKGGEVEMEKDAAG